MLKDFWKGFKDDWQEMQTISKRNKELEKERKARIGRAFRESWLGAQKTIIIFWIVILIGAILHKCIPNP
jgi:hypothetical protein